MKKMRDKHVINGYVFFSVNVIWRYIILEEVVLWKKEKQKGKSYNNQKQGCWL
jgi:hypothetical protein